MIRINLTKILLATGLTALPTSEASSITALTSFPSTLISHTRMEALPRAAEIITIPLNIKEGETLSEKAIEIGEVIGIPTKPEDIYQKSMGKDIHNIHPGTYDVKVYKYNDGNIEWTSRVKQVEKLYSNYNIMF